MSGLVAWFARNSVASNLLMATLLFGGLLSFKFVLRTESFPDITPETITVSVLYPGATPEEVEESICVKIEEAAQGVEDIDRIVSKASENLGIVTVEIVDDADIRKVLDDVKNEVDAIDTFPEDAEEPIIRQARVEERVISIAISGATTERNLKVIADELRDELLLLPEISKAEVEGAREYEISVEVEEAALRRYKLSLGDVARAVRQYSLNLPAGSVKTLGGEIILRSRSQAYTRRDFEQIPVITLEDGTRVLMEDVARVITGFEDTDESTRFDGQPALVIQVYRVGDENTPLVAEAVKDFVRERQMSLPEEIQLSLWRDQSDDLDERLTLLKRNGLQGLALVILALALFLKARLALWVAVGLAAAVFGAAWVMPWFDISLNFLSTFGFILVLGILVDDAIVVAENIEAHREMGKSGMKAAIEGAWEVMVPVSLAVITTAIAFSPMLRLPGRTGDFAATIAQVVIIAIFFSLVESLLILPSHLSHGDEHGPSRLVRVLSTLLSPFNFVSRCWTWLQTRVDKALQTVIDRAYRPTLDWVIEWRYFTVAAGLAFLIFTGGLFAGGWVKVTFFPPIEGNDVIATVRLPEGSSVALTEAAVAVLEEAAEEIRREVEGDRPGSVIVHIRTSVGDQPGNRTTGPPEARSGASQSRANLGEVHIELVSSELREVSSGTIAASWRQRVSATDRIPDVEELLFKADRINSGDPINVELSSRNVEQLRAAAAELQAQLALIPGTYNIASDYRQGKDELRIQMRPSGTALGLTQSDVARQVRQAFYGDEAQRVQIGKDDVRVFVRYPEKERESLANLEQMRIRLPDNTEVPFSEVASLEVGRGPASINRIDRQRTIVVTSDLDLAQANANEIVDELQSGFLPALEDRYPSLTYSFGGEQRRQAESFAGLRAGMFLAVFLMFGILGVVFRSYLQPLIVLSAIPFGVAGAVWAHFLLGMNLTFLSMIGILALMGVVVNDSLVMIDFINRYRRVHKKNLLEAVRLAGPRRFRAIFLTSLTTFAGLTPILLEKSVQAAFVIPMAVSLAFGVASATFIILVIVPAGYLIIEDVRRALTGHEDAVPDFTGELLSPDQI